MAMQITEHQIRTARTNIEHKEKIYLQHLYNTKYNRPLTFADLIIRREGKPMNSLK